MARRHCHGTPLKPSANDKVSRCLTNRAFEQSLAMLHRRCGPRDFWVVVGLTLMLVVPAALTLHTVQTPRPLVPVQDNPTPHGYTWSLLLFLIPILAIGTKVLRLRESRAEKRAFWWTVAVLVPVGFGLDVIFGMRFFTFVNRAATLGWNLPGYVPNQGFRAVLPVEEFAFYALGFVAMLLTYVWADQVWMKAYSPEEQSEAGPVQRDERRRGIAMSALSGAIQPAVEKFLNSSLSPLLAGAVLFGLAWWIQRHAPGPTRAAVPGYFLFLVAASVVPSMLCFRIAVRWVNWRAFAFSFCFIFLISLFWEATLGVPYQWWGYQPEQMMGISLRAYCDLPLEAALVWVFANWTTVLIYETFLFAFRTGLTPFWRVFLLSRGELAGPVKERAALGK